MERCNLKATASIVSEKVAKVLTAKNVLYEKELSYVCKNLEKEKNNCKATIEKTKKNLFRSLRSSPQNRRKSMNCIGDSRERSFSLPTSVKPKRLRDFDHRSSSLSEQDQITKSHAEKSVKENDNMPSAVTTTPAKHSPKDTTTDEEAPLSPTSLSSTETEDDIFGASQRTFQLENLGSSSPSNSQTSEIEVPDILVTGADNNNNVTSEKPQRKISLTRSYSTGDLENAKAADQTQHSTTCTSPVQIRRIKSTCDNSTLLLQNWKEGNVTASDDKTRYGSFDELFFQRLNNMLSENTVPQKPKPRSKPYSEEPFYLRKKCLLRSCLGRQDLHKSAPDGLENLSNGEQGDGFERPLASILPPIALPRIYSQQSNKAAADKKKVKNGTRKPANSKLTADVSNLTKHLNDCRYLRNTAK